MAFLRWCLGNAPQHHPPAAPWPASRSKAERSVTPLGLDMRRRTEMVGPLGVTRRKGLGQGELGNAGGTPPFGGGSLRNEPEAPRAASPVA
jgi:hypothetical protein